MAHVFNGMCLFTCNNDKACLNPGASQRRQLKHQRTLKWFVRIEGDGGGDGVGLRQPPVLTDPEAP